MEHERNREASCHEGQAGLTSPRPREPSERVFAQAAALPGGWGVGGEVGGPGPGHRKNSWEHPYLGLRSKALR